jgi:hypothetical protein
VRLDHDAREILDQLTCNGDLGGSDASPKTPQRGLPAKIDLEVGDLRGCSFNVRCVIIEKPCKTRV